jgi:hypothetical protein
MVHYPWRRCTFLGGIVAIRNNSFCQRLKCSRVAACLWLGDNRYIFYGENKHIDYFKRLWAHTIFGQSNRWKVDQ